MNSKKQKIFLIISIAIYIIALTQKSYCSSYGNCDNYGILSLLFGWLGVFMLHVPAFPWLANPILIIAWSLFKKKPNISFILSVVGFLLMLSFLFVDEIINSEAGTKSKVVFYGLGYWLWVLSSFIMVIGNLLVWKKKI
ncbi:hypothetical protein [Polaribacter gochangensis]|uniref:hypothetical protein n=1 Tax=Polaribacter gochangensis TaxID=3252903 RepID=UPI00390488A5